MDAEGRGRGVLNHLKLQEFHCETSVVSMGLDPSVGKDAEKLSNELAFLGSNVHARLHYYYGLCLECEKMFNEKLEVFNTNRDKLGTAIINDDEMDDFDKEIAESRFRDSQRMFYEIYDVQESAIAIGVFLKAYALLEDVLNQLCIIYEKLKSPGYNYTEIKGGGIIRASNYIKRTTDIDIQKYEEWKLVKSWNKIRNQVMHEDSKINDSQKVKEAMRDLNLKGYIDSTFNGAIVIDVKLNDVKAFLILIDKVLSYSVLHEDKWK